VFGVQCSAKSIDAVLSSGAQKISPGVYPKALEGVEMTNSTRDATTADAKTATENTSQELWLIISPERSTLKMPGDWGFQSTGILE
jgi:hypothetical protein